MAKKFHITAPDGHVVEVTGPDDATEDQAIQQAQQLYKPQESSQKEEQSVPSIMMGQAGRALGTAASDLNPIPMVRALAHPINTVKSMFGATSDAVGRSERAFSKGEIGEGLKSALGAVPVVGPGLETITRDATEGRLPEAIGHAGSFYLGNKMPGMVAKGVNRTAERLGESSMGATMRDRISGGNPGRAFRTESDSWTPKGVRADLSSKGKQLGAEATTIARQTTTPGSLQPAIDVVEPRINSAKGAGATATVENLKPIHDYFVGKAPSGFTGATTPSGDIARTQSAEQMLNMRREFTPNFRVKYGPSPDRPTKLAQGMYGATTNEIHRIAPDIAPVDRRLQDILSAERPLATTEARPGLIRNVLNRFGARTGALLGGVAGLQYGGIPGGIAGVVIPELMADPLAQSIAGRGLSRMGGRLATKPAAAAGGLAPAFTINEDSYRRK